MVTEEYEVSEKKSRRFCDVEGCKKGAYRTCTHCLRDLCGDHSDICPYDPDDNSDYRDWTCDKCLNIGIPFRKIIDECRDKEYDAREEWDKICKADKASQFTGGTK